MALKSSFAATAQNMLSRRWGGSNTGVADPYVTGYHFIWFDLIPKGLKDELAKSSGEPGGQLDADVVQTTLAACCIGVTPPGGTLNKIEFTGLGGIKWAVPGNLDYGNSVSVKFLEMQGLPITTIMHKWVKSIRNYRSGITETLDDTNNEYTKKNYAAVMYYWTTAPDARTVEYYACYDGVFPTKDPADLHASDIESIGKLDIEIEFNVDYAWHEDWVLKKCQDFATNKILPGLNAITTYGDPSSGS